MNDRKPSSNAEEVAIELYNAAESRARSHGMRFGGGAELDIQRFARDASQLLAKEPTRLPEARSAFVRLVDEMMAASDRIPGYHAMNPGVIGEETLKLARASLCPCFPIC